VDAVKERKVKVDRLIAENQLLLRELSLTEQNGQLKIANALSSLLCLLNMAPQLLSGRAIQPLREGNPPDHQPTAEEVQQLLGSVENLIRTSPGGHEQLEHIKNHVARILRRPVQDSMVANQASQTLKLNFEDDTEDKVQSLRLDDLGTDDDVPSRRSAASFSTSSRKRRKRRMPPRSVSVNEFLLAKSARVSLTILHKYDRDLVSLESSSR
jgi:hypothetical protein